MVAEVEQCEHDLDRLGTERDASVDELSEKQKQIDLLKSLTDDPDPPHSFGAKGEAFNHDVFRLGCKVPTLPS